MFKFKKNGLRCLQIIHLLAFCCWFGGALAMMLINLHTSEASREGMLYGFNVSTHLIDVWLVAHFGAVGCLLSGLGFSLFTGWGFFKHKWVVVKWALTIICILVGTFFLGEYEESMLDMSKSLGNSALQDSAYLGIKAKHMYLSLAQTGALFFMLCISVIKPWGKKKA